MKHAYLIMSHNEPYILKKLLELIDYGDNDIYLHIDKKWKNFNYEEFRACVKKSNLYFVERMNVKWGTFKQIKCEISLFETAYKNKYDYYHFISGVDLPVVSQKTVHDFFKKNNGKELVHFDNHESISESALERVKFYHFFVGFARSKYKLFRKFFDIFHFWSIKLQRKIGVDRLNDNIKYRKGANWVSVSNDFVGYLLDHKTEIYKNYKHTFCADELVIQSLLYNSEFYKNLYGYGNDEYRDIKRFIDWNRGEPYTFTIADFEEIINSGCFFARKFSIRVDKDIVDKIYNYVKGDIDAKN